MPISAPAAEEFPLMPATARRARRVDVERESSGGLAALLGGLTP
ncbi:hypothetical protein GCM10010260_66480 [Streptomyces filipinensis]|uniref:Uncharacterized protein n=1 Tax=Streptomyces filipinensis TaxID=66887 RepID=A0A918IHX4_9ACTN|nr:hypothetical protein GCM10010260_66480 [Streptomyces filipinensis]